MDFKEFTAGKDDEDRRLDRVLRNFLPENNLSSLYKLLRKGLIKLNGKKASGESRVCSGDSIKIAAFLFEQIEENEKKIQENDDTWIFPYGIIFKNQELLIINKPYDKTVQGEKDSLDAEVRKFYEKSEKKTSLSFRTGPLHRLDRKTTGLLAFSWGINGAHWFSEKIRTHEIKKIYLGIAEGTLKSKECWKDFITKNQDDKKNVAFHTVKISQEKTDDGLDSMTDAEPLSYGIMNGKHLTLVKYTIHTGRTHQIRSQTSLHGYPLAGDISYGGTELKGKVMFYLHAWCLEIPENNPVGLPSRLTAPLPETFIAFLKSINCVYDFTKL